MNAHDRAPALWLAGTLAWTLAFSSWSCATAQVKIELIFPPPPQQGETHAHEVRQLQELLKPSRLAVPAPSDSELQKLRKERYTTALREMGLRFERFIQGARGDTLEMLLELIHRLNESEQALTDRIEDKTAAIDRAIAIAELTERD